MGEHRFPDGFEPVGDPLGAGASSVVWLARRTVDGRVTALKVFREPLTDARQRQRFLREVRRHADLTATSGHVVSYTWAEPDADPPWIAVEPHGASLVQLLAEDGRPPLATGLAWSHDLLLGLAAMHRTGTLHRDVSPTNVLVDGGRAKLCDFGLSLTVGATTQDNGAGTPRYVAPELRDGTRPPDPRSDVHAAALTLRDVLGDDLPADLEQTLTAAASVRPEDRPASAVEFAARLHRDATALRVTLPEPLPPGPRRGVVAPPAARPRRTRRLVVAGAVLAGVAAATAGVVGGAGRDTSAAGEDTTAAAGAALPDASTAVADIAPDGSPVVLPEATSGRCDQAVPGAGPVDTADLARDGVLVAQVRLFQDPAGREVCAKLVKPDGSPLRGTETHLALTLCGEGGTCDHDWHPYRIDAGPVVVPAVDGCVAWRASVLDAAGGQWWVRDVTGRWGCEG